MDSIYALHVLSGTAIFWILYRLVFAGETYHRRNRWILLGMIVLGILLPLLSWNQVLQLFQAESATAGQSVLLQENVYQGIQSLKPTLPKREISLMKYFEWAVLGVSTCLLLHFMYRLLSVFLLIIRSEKEYRKGYILIRCPEGTAPSSFLCFIFWDRSVDQTTSDAQKMLLHERVHVREAHSFDVMLMEVLLAVFWFNPFFYWMKKELLALHEFTADEVVIKKFAADSYRKLLITTFFQKMDIPLGSSFQSISLKSRIQMMNKKQTPVWMWLKLSILLPISWILIHACTKADIQLSSFDSQMSYVGTLEFNSMGKELYAELPDMKSSSFQIKPLRKDANKNTLIHIVSSDGIKLKSGKGTVQFTPSPTKSYHCVIEMEGSMKDTCSYGIFIPSTEAASMAFEPKQVVKPYDLMKEQLPGTLFFEKLNPEKSERIELQIEKGQVVMIRLPLELESDTYKDIYLKLYDEEENMHASNAIGEGESTRFFPGFTYKSSKSQKMYLSLENLSASTNIAAIIINNLEPKPID